MLFSVLIFVKVIILCWISVTKASKLTSQIFSFHPFLHVDIIFTKISPYRDNSSLFSNGNQYAICERKVLSTFSECIKVYSGTTLKILLLHPKNHTEVFNILEEISKLYDMFETGIHWNPYFFIQIPPLCDLKLLHEFYIANISSKYLASTEVYLVQTNRDISNSLSVKKNYNIFELYSMKTNHFLNEICKRCSIDLTKILYKTRRRSNFHSIPIVGLNVDNPGYEDATKFSNEDSTVKFIGGFEVEEYWYLRDALNFTEVALKSKAGYVKKGPNGTLTGMAIEINNGLADVAISNTEFLEYRLQGKDAFTYLHPTFQNHLKAFFLQPPASSIRDIFLAGFTIEVWIVFILTWIFFVMTVRLFRSVTERYFICTHETDIEVLNEYVIMAVGMCSQQGWHTTPVLISLRIVFFTGWFLGLLCYVGYSASLVSILSVEVIPIHSFEDLVRANFFIYGDAYIPTSNFVIKQMEDFGLIPKVQEEERNIDMADAIEKVLHSHSTVISIFDSFYPIFHKSGYTNELACSLSLVSASPRSLMSSMFVKRGSPLREFFNCKIILMQERGIRHRVLNRYFAETSISCLEKSNRFQETLGPKDLFTAYGLLCSGLGVSFLLLILEKIVSQPWIYELSQQFYDKVV